MALPKYDDASRADRPHARFQLMVHLDDGRYRRSVSLEFADRSMIEQQIAALQRDRGDAFQLFEFRNECGESLAFLARALVRYEIVARS